MTTGLWCAVYTSRFRPAIKYVIGSTNKAHGHTMKRSDTFAWQSESAAQRRSAATPGDTSLRQPEGQDLSTQGYRRATSTSADWHAARAPVSPQENTLSSLAQTWRDSFPPATRPTQLCMRYPRIANRMALCWPDKTLTLQLFQSLQRNQRVGRQGFPAPVSSELERLYLSRVRA